MLISFNWLTELIDTGLGAEETAHALTMAGLEVEGIERAGDDFVLEVNVTPNRPDCLSVLGIAREMRAITGKPLKVPEHAIKDESHSTFMVEIKDKELCARYACRVVRGVSVGESPEWLTNRLELCGIRSVNNIVDITNYVLLEFGHPLHAFDLDLLEGGVVRVARAGAGQSITTLDGVERKLPEEALLIWDGKRPVAVAGVMGGLATEVTASTQNILIESAWFKPQSVRRTSKALGLKSESSYRFERGTDVVGLELALDRAAFLTSKIAGGEVEYRVESYPVKFSPKPVTVQYEKINRLLGIDLPPGVVTELLKRLELELQHVSEETLVVVPPSSRLDLERDADIVEEVARLYGYGNIPTSIPASAIASGGRPPERLTADVKEAMRKEGLSEAINYSFMNEKHLDLLDLAQADPRRKAVRIQNPLRAEEALLRTTLVPSLIDNFLHNFFRGSREVGLFELARVFTDAGGALPSEARKLGAVLYKERKPALWKETAPDFYLLKGALESLFERLNIKDFEMRKPAGEPFMHPGKSAGVFIGGARAGFIGELSPQVMERLDAKTKNALNVLELDMEALSSAAEMPFVFSPIPKYPAVERDLAIIVDRETASAEIARLLKGFPSEFIEEVSVFDSFTGGNIPEGKKSLGFSIRYRSRERTLTDEEVEALHESIVRHIAEKAGGEIRA
ncbi:MAG: phenylalanine--tRNA ligase subunit beta [Nitrospirota bacterium]